MRLDIMHVRISLNLKSTKNNSRLAHQLSVCRTDKNPLGTKGRTSILSVESSASCGASFPVSRRKLLDRECFVTSFRQGGYTPCAAYAAIPSNLTNKTKAQPTELFSVSCAFFSSINHLFINNFCCPVANIIHLLHP